MLDYKFFKIFTYLFLSSRPSNKRIASYVTALKYIVNIVRKHTSRYSKKSIIASLSAEFNVVNYRHLNIDKPGLRQIMDLACEAEILNKAIDIDDFSDERFGLTET